MRTPHKVVEILHSMKMAMLTTRADDGNLLSRPMAMQDIEFDGYLWFFAEASSASVAHTAADPHVNVSAYTNDTWISVSGSATIVRDQSKKDELWNPVVEAWSEPAAADVLKAAGVGACRLRQVEGTGSKTVVLRVRSVDAVSDPMLSPGPCLLGG